MNNLTETELKKAPDYEELKWFNGLPVIVSAFGETWKRIAAADGYSPYFAIADDDHENFSAVYSGDEPIEPSE